MPWSPEIEELRASKTADIVNSAMVGMGGHIQAAFFLKAFVDKDGGPETTWLHLDGRQWNEKARPGRPAGGEPRGMRAIYDMIEKRYTGPSI